MIVNPLLEFKQNLAGTNDVKTITKKLYDFLIENEIDKKFEEQVGELRKILVEKLLVLTADYTSEGVKDFMDAEVYETSYYGIKGAA